jgi:hypothetical protein
LHDDSIVSNYEDSESLIALVKCPDLNGLYDFTTEVETHES